MNVLKLAARGGVTADPLAWNISKIGSAPSCAWDVTKLMPTMSFSVAAQETTPTGIFFKPDGTKMYIVGDSGNDVNEYNLSTAWDISTASYLQNFSVAAQETGPSGIFFKPDGTKMYIIGESSDAVAEYDLATAWNISTASYLQNFSVGAQDINPSDLFFKSDGTKMYVLGRSGDDVNEYTLSSAWNVSTASYVQNFSVAAQDGNPYGLFFKSDGTKMYMTGFSVDFIYEYDLSTPWDISTASFLQSFSLATQDGAPSGIYFRDDGLLMFMVGSGLDLVFKYIFVDSLVVFGHDIFPRDLYFKPDGTKMYIVGSDDDEVNEYDLATAWNITTASYIQTFSISAQESTPTGIFFKSDGTKMYICGASGDDVNEYNLSVAWDISTASYLQNFSVAAQENSPQSISFKSDGTKMYILGSGGDDVNEYTLSSAWNVSTASYVQNFSISAQEIAPTGLYFKPDGTKMYVVGVNLNEYTLSSAWDISTASYNQKYLLLTNNEGVFFKDDGLATYIVGGYPGVTVREFPLNGN